MKIGAPGGLVLNLFSGRLLWLLRRSRPAARPNRALSAEELRSIVLEASRFMPAKHRAILINLFDLEAITVDDIMTPRSQIEALDIAELARVDHRPAGDLLSQQAAGVPRASLEQRRRDPARAPNAAPRSVARNSTATRSARC